MAFFGLAFPYLLLANILFGVFWILMDKWKVFLIIVIVIVIGWKYTAKIIRYPIKQSYNEEDSSIKLLSYNVRGFNLYGWNKKDSLDFDIINFIQEEKPDIICLQEYKVKNRKRSSFNQELVNQSLSATPHYYIYDKSTYKNVISGMAIYSAYPIINKEVLVFENSRNACIYCDIIYNTDTIRLYNAHLQSIQLGYNNYAFFDTLKLKYNDAQMREIKDISVRLRDAFIIRSQQAEILRKHIESSPYPVIICGDFNDTPISYSYLKVLKGMKDAYIESGRGIGNTYIGKMPSFRIDYIMHSPQLRSFRFTTHKVKMSDHYPISCEVELKW